VKAGDWQVFPATAWAAISSQVQQRVKQQAREAHGLGFNEPLTASCTLHDMLRLYVPMYHFEYSVFGQLFNVYVSGYSAGAETAGIDHGLLTETVCKHIGTAVTQFMRLLGNSLRSKNKQEREGASGVLAAFGWGAFKVGRAVAVMLSPMAWGALAAVSVIYHKVRMLLQQRAADSATTKYSEQLADADPPTT
jgi:hypothetical protein